MTENINPQISGYHAHVYFEASTVEQARELCEAAMDRFGIVMGRMHEKLVGPHPEWSCQLLISTEQFGEIIPWLSLNRDGLTVFIHTETGDDLADHTDFALWMGKICPLNLEMFRTSGS